MKQMNTLNEGILEKQTDAAGAEIVVDFGDAIALLRKSYDFSACAVNSARVIKLRMFYYVLYRNPIG